MNTILHTASSRGQADFGWLNSRHTFSFGQYYNSNRLKFGAIRVLNDDIVKGGYGFDTHPHSNMEIVSIPLNGSIEHKDSTGRHKIIKAGEVQIMSAGTGIRHSEFNASKTEDLNFLQIWILPEKKDIPPRYDQKHFNFPTEEQHLKFVNVVAPDNSEALWINQQAWFYLGEFKHGQAEYIINEPDRNGIYIFIIEGEVEVAEHLLQKRDGLGITDFEDKSLFFNIISPAKILLIETVMD